jgi:hypothetical protein
MATRWVWMAVVGLPVLLICGSPAAGLAAQTEQAGPPPATAEQPKTAEPTTTKAPAASTNPLTTAKVPAATRPAGLVGTIVAVTPNSRTVVVDVPRGKDTLRIGAETTNNTRIMVHGKKASLAALKQGERVRITYHRTSTGDVATSLEVLRAPMG